jgi:hypothetical protein
MEEIAKMEAERLELQKQHREFSAIHEAENAARAAAQKL